MRRTGPIPGPARPRRWLALVVGAFALAACTSLPALAEVAARPPAAVLATQSVGLRAASGAGTRTSGPRALRTGSRTLAIRANLVGASWLGSAQEIQLRAQGVDRRWSRWVPLEANPAEGPDERSAEGRRASKRTHAALPAWVGDAHRVEVRVAAGADVRDLRVVAINTTGTARARDRALRHVRTTAARVLGAAAAPPAAAATTQPSIVTRAQWGADERIRKADPVYASSLKGAVVHHTVNSNSYAATDVPAMLRGIYSYHVRSNGWNDVGYNFIVDQYGTVYEGRYGGVSQNVIGAHTGGFNTSTTGVAFLGTHTSVAPTSTAQSAVANLLAWRLDAGHVNPAGTMTLTSAGNGAYAAGTTVTRRAVSGHRDLFPTSCPGDVAFSVLDSMAASAATTGGPKFFAPTAAARTNPDATAAGARFTATGNGPLDWTLRVTRAADGAVAYEHSVTGSSTFDHDWLGASALGAVRTDELRWTLDASAAGVPATGHAASLGAASPSISLGTNPPNARWITPNGDGVVERLLVEAVTSGPARLDAKVFDRATRTKLAGTVFTGRGVVAGESLVTVPGTLPGNGVLPDGDYSLQLAAHDPVPGRAPKVAWVNFGIDRSVRFGALSPRFSPNADGRLDLATATFEVTGPAQAVTMSVRSSTTRTSIRTLVALSLTGPASVTFDGRRRAAGPVLPDGSYELLLRSARSEGAVELTRAVVIDRSAPSVRVQRLGRGKLRLRSSEQATLIAKVRVGSKLVRRTLPLRRGANVTNRLRGATRATLRDGAGNTRTIRLGR